MEAAQSSKKVVTLYMSTWDYDLKVLSLFTSINKQTVAEYIDL